MRNFILIPSLLALAAGVAVGTPQTRNTRPNASQAIGLMKSSDWNDREQGFIAARALLQSAKSNGDTDNLRLGVIQLLMIENEHKGDARADETEADKNMQYYASLIGLVADLNDERAIPALLGAVGSGGMAMRGIARFGPKALLPVLAQVDAPNPVLAGGALFVIREMLKTHSVSDPNSHARIITALRSALGRPEIAVRDGAIAAIEFLDDRDQFVPILQDIAEHDPIRIPGLKADDNEDNGEMYPVRRNARYLLRKIANHEPPAGDHGVRP